MAKLPELNLTESQAARQQEILEGMKPHLIRQLALKKKLDHQLAMVRPVDWLAGWVAQAEEKEGDEGEAAPEPSKEEKAALRAAAKGKPKAAAKASKPKAAEPSNGDEGAAAEMVVEAIGTLETSMNDLINRVDTLGTVAASSQNAIKALSAELETSKACSYHLYCLLSEEPVTYAEFLEQSIGLAEAGDEDESGN